MGTTMENIYINSVRMTVHSNTLRCEVFDTTTKRKIGDTDIEIRLQKTGVNMKEENTAWNGKLSIVIGETRYNFNRAFLEKTFNNKKEWFTQVQKQHTIAINIDDLKQACRYYAGIAERVGVRI